MRSIQLKLGVRELSVSTLKIVETYPLGEIIKWNVQTKKQTEN